MLLTFLLIKGVITLLDYSKKKKRVFKVKLHDEKVLNIPLPTKKVFDMLTEFNNNMDLSELYDLVTVIINSDKSTKYTLDQISDMFDFDDLREFLAEYVNFVTEVTKDPN